MYSVKFGYATGYCLVFTAFQPNGNGRGTANQSLYEVHPSGYYRAEPATELEDGDVILVYNNETVYWENEVVYCLTYEGMFYESDPVYYEGEEIIDYDTTFSDTVKWVGEVVGSGEYTLGIGEFATVFENVDTLVNAAQGTSNSYDDTTKGETITILKNL